MLASVPGEIRSLTGLRWLAATMVFLYHHYTTHHPPARHPNWPGVLAGAGWAGVTVFFALSGFLLTMLYFEAFRAGVSWPEIRSYLLKRVARIYPLYYALLTLAALRWFAGARDGVGDPAAVGWDLAAHLVMLHGYFGAFSGSFIAPAWSLSIEESFYLLLPLAARFIGRFTPRPGVSLVRFTLALAAFNGLVVLAGFGLAVLVRGRPFGLLDGWVNLTILGQMPTFSLGMLAGVLWRYRPKAAVFVRTAWANLAGAAALALYAAGAWLFCGRVSWMEGFAGQAVFASAAALFILALCGPSLFACALGWAPLVYGGRISYAFYLVHTLPFLHPARFGVTQPLLAYLLLQAVAAACYELIEKRAHRWLRARWEVVPPVRPGAATAPS